VTMSLVTALGFVTGLFMAASLENRGSRSPLPTPVQTGSGSKGLASCDLSPSSKPEGRPWDGRDDEP